MKQPNLKNLKINKKNTEEIRELARNAKKIKITINIDRDNLSDLKELAQKSGASYQKLLNQILEEGLRNKSDTETRLERLEKELAKIKKKLAA